MRAGFLLGFATGLRSNKLCKVYRSSRSDVCSPPMRSMPSRRTDKSRRRIPRAVCTPCEPIPRHAFGEREKNPYRGILRAGDMRSRIGGRDDKIRCCGLGEQSVDVCNCVDFGILNDLDAELTLRRDYFLGAVA